MSRGWKLIAPPEHAIADMVQLVLLGRGLAVTRQPTGPLPALIPPGTLPVALCDHAALLAELGLEGDSGQTARAVIRALDRLAALEPGAFPAELDLQIYALRQDLRPLEAAATGTSEPALLIAPLLWRIGLLDRHFGLFLLAGLPHLETLREAQTQNPLIAGLFDNAAGQRHLRHLQAHPAAPFQRTDWSRALGPEGREKSLLPRPPGRKYPSIGNGDPFR